MNPDEQDQEEVLPVALLGLVFDPVTLEQAVSRVMSAVRTRQQLVFATPNVNFSATAAGNPAFRRSVLACPLSLVDGMPLVWIGQRLGLEIPERVAGSSLFDALQSSNSERPLRVFFFGGDPGVAQSACEALARGSPGVVPAGHLDPGRGSVEEMSTEQVIAQINAANADFLCVSLGAVKGHAWIARNAGRLNVPVISHLGAVVNFVAGRISRAPVWMQGRGLEWAWRILREPVLLRRYLRDGAWLAGALLTQVLPAWLAGLHGPDSTGFGWSVANQGGNSTLELRGSLDRKALLANPDLRHSRVTPGSRLTIDMGGLRFLDSTGVAWLLRFCYSESTMASTKLQGVSAHAASCLRRHGAGFILRELV